MREGDPVTRHQRREDHLGTYDQIDGLSRAAALGLLDLTRPIETFGLGETLFDGYPGWGTREFRQRLAVGGYDPGPDFTGEVLYPEPRGSNEMTSLEERVELSFNIGSKVNGFGHAGRGHRFHSGLQLPDLVADHGITDLDTTTWGPPLLTRGVLLDVLSWACDETDRAAVEVTEDGDLHLVGNHRITLDDLEQVIEHQGVGRPEPGDAILLRTGWRHLIRCEPDAYMRASPGVWIPETEWLASLCPAMVGTDSWCWGTLDRRIQQDRTGACHQILLVDHGIRLAESMYLEELAAAGVHEFVLVHAPIRAEGAVSTISPPIAIANLPTRA